jgi:hypothetical protein
VSALLGAVCDLRIVLARALVLRMAVSARGEDRESPRVEEA